MHGTAKFLVSYDAVELIFLILSFRVCPYHTFARFPVLSSCSPSSAALGPIPGGNAGPIAARFFSVSFSFSFPGPFSDAGVGGIVGPIGAAPGEGFCKWGGRAGPIVPDALSSSLSFFCRCRGSAGPIAAALALALGAPSPSCCGAFFCRWGGRAGPMGTAVGRGAEEGPGAVGADVEEEEEEP